MTTKSKVKELFYRERRRQNSEDRWLLISSPYNNDRVMPSSDQSDKRNSLPGSTAKMSVQDSSNNEPQGQSENYKQITRKLSREMRNFLPSPEIMRKRRNATCDEIEKRTVTDSEGHTLRQDRSDMLQIKALKELFCLH